MLKFLRHKKTAKKIWIILAILIVPAFVLWGSGSLIRSKREEARPVIRIFGRNINPLEYQDALEAVKNQMLIQYGEDLSEAKKKINLESQALQRLILLTEAKRRKIKASDREVIEFIESYPFFQKNGSFNNVIYTQTLQYVLHTQPRIFEEQTRENIILLKLYKRVTDSVSLSEEEIREAYRKDNEELSVYYIAALFAEFAKDIIPSDEEIKDYFFASSFQFKQPISFNIEYLSMKVENKKDAQEINEKIKKIISQVNKGLNLSSIAKDLKLTLKETGLFAQTDPIPGIGWSPEILNLISKAKTGQLLPPIYLDNYYYIMQIKERKESYIPDLSTIKDKVKDSYIKDKARETAEAKSESCLTKLKEAYQANPHRVDFEKTAREYGLKFNSTDLFKYGSYIEGLGSSDSLWLAAYNLKDGEISELVSIPSGFYIIKIKNRLSLDEDKFTAEKEEFSKKLFLEKKEEFFLKFLKDLQRKSQLL